MFFIFLLFACANAQFLQSQNDTYIETRQDVYLETIWDIEDRTIIATPNWYFNDRMIWEHTTSEGGYLSEFVTHTENVYQYPIINSSIEISKEFWKHHDHLLVENCYLNLDVPSYEHNLCIEQILLAYANNPVNVRWYTYSSTVPETTEWVFLRTEWNLHGRHGQSAWYLEGSNEPTTDDNGPLNEYVISYSLETYSDIQSNTLILSNRIWRDYEQLQAVNCYNKILGICTGKIIFTVYRQAPRTNRN